MSTALPFTPVPVRARRDGWTPVTQVAFIAALIESRNVAAACRAVGRSWQTAYRLRTRPDAASFAAAWDAALAGPLLSESVAGRALGGVARPITYRSRRVGEHRRYDNRLAMFLLAIRQPERFGAEADFSADVSRTSSPSMPFSADRCGPGLRAPASPDRNGAANACKPRTGLDSG